MLDMETKKMPAVTGRALRSGDQARELIPPNFIVAPVFTMKEVGHFGRWSISTTRRLIEAGDLETVRVGGSVRVIGDSLRTKLVGGGS